MFKAFQNFKLKRPLECKRRHVCIPHVLEPHYSEGTFLQDGQSNFTSVAKVYYTGNIWLSITAHFFNNALAVTAAFVSIQQGKNIKEAMNEDVSVSYWGFIAIPILVLLLIALKRTAQDSNHSHSYPS